MEIDTEKIRQKIIDTTMNSSVVFLARGTEPSGFKFRRNNADIMNNFHINLVALSFTNIREIIKNVKENQENM